MYPRLLLNFCERSLYRASSSIGLNVKRLSHVAKKDEKEQQGEIVSTRYPDYKVVYVFPYIKQACGVNIVKRRFSILFGTAAPVIVGLNLAGILSYDTTIPPIVVGVIISIWLHSLGILFNNLIGYVYLKLDEEKAIISYIDYWGKRVDLEKPINEIIPMSDNPISITDSLYRKIMFSSQTPKLKINMRFGRIIDIEHFKCILGTV